MTRHAEIAGAGFAGLACAIALRQRGWTARVHESSSELRAFGAGIFIWDNGLHVLDALGAYQAVLTGAFAAPAYETRTNGVCSSFQHVNGPGDFRVLTMTRQHLYQALLSAAINVGVELVTGSKAVGATPEGELLLESGARLKADLVVGADGVKSLVRDSLTLPMERRQYQDGLIRVLTARGTLKGGQWDHVIDFWRTGSRTLRILYTPCGKDLLYMAMMAPREDKAASAVPIQADIWIEAFPELQPVLSSLGGIGRYDMYETTKVSSWSAGRVAIIGDAAHGMPPTLAQGAGCAMMNALSLAVTLENCDSVEEALAAWERQERPLTDHTQARAAQLAASRALASGMAWDDEGLRAAKHLPTGTKRAFSLLA